MRLQKGAPKKLPGRGSLPTGHGGRGSTAQGGGALRGPLSGREPTEHLTESKDLLQGLE